MERRGKEGDEWERGPETLAKEGGLYFDISAGAPNL